MQEHLSESAYQNLQKWLTEPRFAEFKPEIEALVASENWQALEDAFFMDIEFGTAGMRGIVGVGPNRINNVTVGAAAQGLVQFLLNKSAESATRGVVIAYDTRNSSRQLAELTARVIVGNGLTAYLFENFRATPELSFAVRHLQAVAGVVISASHNPPEYNGFKAYANYGGQLVAPDDRGAMDQVHAVTEIKMGDLAQVKMIGEEVDQAYLDAVINGQSVSDPQLSIVYSPLHGAGQTSVLPVLRQLGFQVSTVEAQMTPDGNFPNVVNHKPNPEEPGANTLATEQMLAENADIAITTDPDADRLSVIINYRGKVITLDGNQSATLIMNYVMKNADPTNAYVCKTIVTTDFITVIAQKYGIKMYDDMLIGFKFIGELIEEKTPLGERFLAGGEESYGVLVGTHARDKDAASGALVIAKYADELKKAGKTLYDELLALYEEFGVYQEGLATAEFTGAVGFNKMKQLMNDLRENPLQELGGLPVTAVLDYNTLTKTDLATGTQAPFSCRQKGNVLVYEFGDERNRLTIRPSGTEPKIKLYLKRYELVNPYADVQTQSQVMRDYMNQFLQSAKEQLLS
jgi:phosphoglucomutase/phosphomannomutase alpha/beta/alpha domain I